MFQTVSVKTPINFANFLKAAGAKLTLIGLEDLETASAVIKEFFQQPIVPILKSFRKSLGFKILQSPTIKKCFQRTGLFFSYLRNYKEKKSKNLELSF
jgi:hypothetical protein